MTDLIRVLIADDHYVVRQGLAALLAPRNGMEVVGEAANGREAVELARTLQPDVILMDMIMPEMNGPEAIALIKRENPKARILVLTSFGESKQICGRDSGRRVGLFAQRFLARRPAACDSQRVPGQPGPAPGSGLGADAAPACGGRPRSTDRAGNRCVEAAGPGAIEPGDRQEPEHQRHYRAFACEHDPDETGRLQPNTSCFSCSRAPPGLARTIVPPAA